MEVSSWGCKKVAEIDPNCGLGYGAKDNLPPSFCIVKLCSVRDAERLSYAPDEWKSRGPIFSKTGRTCPDWDMLSRVPCNLADVSATLVHSGDVIETLKSWVCDVRDTKWLNLKKMAEEQDSAMNDLSTKMADYAMWHARHAVGKYFMDGELPKRGEMFLTGRFPCYHVYETKDGRYMSLGALEPKFWGTFCEMIARRDLTFKQYVEGEERDRLIEEIQNILRTKTQKEWADIFKNADACCEPVLNLAEVFRHPHVLHRQMVKEIEHPVEGEVRAVGNPIKSSQYPSEIQSPPPKYGEHTMEVLKSAGYSGRRPRPIGASRSRRPRRKRPRRR